MIYGVLGNLEKKEIGKSINDIVTFFESKNINYILDSQFSSLILINKNFTLLDKYFNTREVINNSDILVSLGGDGTLLRIARLVGDLQKPILGVNLGKLGFLADFNQSEFFDFIDQINLGNYNIEERIVLCASITTDNTECFYALNDIVIEKNLSSRVITIESFINDQFLTKVIADGIIIATPTGSTAYSLSANGPIIIPSSRVFIMNPICPHTLTIRPIIIPENYSFRSIVNSESGEVLITADGQTEVYMKTPFEINIKKADYNVKLIKRKDVSYYDLLRSKLMWGKDMRIEKIN